MKMKNQKITYFLLALTLIFAISCGGNTGAKEEKEHEHTENTEHPEATSHEEGNHEHNEAGEHPSGGHKHSESMEGGMMGEAFSWKASENGTEMLTYKTDNVMMMKHGEEQVMMMSPGGDKASCMFKNTQGNVGVTATIKFDSPNVGIKLVHHSTGKDNYEFVSLHGNSMQLGRVQNGKEKILDSKEVEVPTDWFKLSVTAAGSHFKGYLNDKMITHGHANEMPAGMVGIIAMGDGSLSVKQVEANPLEAEH